MILPIELLDALIHILRHDARTLSALALTCKAFTYRAQRHLFYHVVLGAEVADMDNSNSILLALVNPQHAHLLQYIRSLTVITLLYRPRRPSIRNSTNAYTLNQAVPIFIDAIAAQLISLSLKGFAAGWTNSETVPLRESVTRVFSSPILKHLDLQDVNLIPMGLLCRATSLTSLRFASQQPKYESTEIDDTLIYLEALDISITSGRSACTFIDWILQADNPSRPLTYTPVYTHSAPPRFSASRLRKLSINGQRYSQATSSFWTLAELCHATLEHLSFGPENFYFDPPVFAHGFPNLHTIDIRARVQYNGPPQRSTDTPFHFLPKFLLQLPSSSPLEYLNIEVTYEPDTGELGWRKMYLDHWEALASLLLDENTKLLEDKFPRLRYVSVGVSTGEVDRGIVQPQDIFPMIEEKLVGLVRGGVRLEFYDFEWRQDL